jgi:hypothetical protein
MAVNRDQLFAELEALTEAEIEAGLDAGVWGEDKRQLVEHYLDQLKLTTMQLEAATSAKEAAFASAANAKATSIAFCSPHHRGGGNGRSNCISIRCVRCSSELDLVRTSGFALL